MQTQNRFWNILDNASYSIGRVVRHGNGTIRTTIAGLVLVGMFLYPLANM